MNKIILKTGTWSARLCLLSLLIWILSFTGIALTSPLFRWTNLEDYILYTQQNSQFFQYLAKSFMIVFTIAILLLFIVYREFVEESKKILATISIAFTIMFALVGTIHYWVQISAVRFAINVGKTEGLEPFLQANPTSFLSSANMLGWTLFLGLAALFLFFSLQPKTGTKTIRNSLLIIACSCLLAGIGFLFQIDVITFLGINLGFDFGMFMVTISSLRYFRIYIQSR